jgi:predicted O-linked N-acetylglucosamine transferase (SPINDLY family)
LNVAVSSPLVNQAKQEFASGRLARALELLTTAPDLHDDPEALQLLAVVALQVGQGDRALQALQAALVKHPEQAKLHALAAAVAHASGDLDRARRHAERAFALDAGEEISASILVEQLAELFDITSALTIAAACLQRKPDAWGVRLARVFAWMSAGEAQRAMEDAEFARIKAPQSMPAKQNVAMCALYLDESAEQTLARHQSVAGSIRALPGKRMAGREPYAGSDRPLRVGFVSPDLRRHPVGLLMAPLVQHLDPQRIHAIAYSDGIADAHSEQLKPSFAQWRDSMGWTDAALHDELQRDAVDILIDLAGYSSGGRPGLLATRCAPLQLGYLGHLHATGLAAMDGVIGDRVTLPDDVRLPDKEAALCLPGHLFCFEPDREATFVHPRGDGPIRFGSFNHLAKLSPATVRLWARLLQEIPEATLSLCAMGLSDQGVRNATWSRFKAAGIEPERVQMLPPELDTGKFLARYADIDVALDPLPFNGGMTNLQALWQGVPVLTLPGERMAARMGASVMQTLGLDAFIAADADDFLRIGARLANDLDSLAAIRSGLRDRMRDRSLLDGAAFAQGFTTLLEQAAAQRLR